MSHEHKNDHEIKDKKRTGTHLKWQVYKQLFTREIVVGVMIQQSKLWSYTQTEDHTPVTSNYLVGNGRCTRMSLILEG